VDSRARSSGSWCPGDGNANDDSEGEEDTQGGQNGMGTGKETKDEKRNGNATEDGKWYGKGKVMGNGNGNGTVKQTPGGDANFHAVALQLKKEMPEVDFDTEG